MKCLLVSIIWLMGSYAQSAVDILYVHSLLKPSSSPKNHYIESSFVVENISSQKRVFLSVKNDSEWIDLPLQYESTYNSGLELWTLELHLASDHPLYGKELVFRGVASDSRTSYIDDNQGNFYTLGANEGEHVVDPLHAGRSWFLRESVGPGGYQPTAVTVDVLVRNFSYVKKVTVVYTFDHWNTIQETEARFVPALTDGINVREFPNANGTEVWRMYTSGIDRAATEVEYAVKYEVDGVVYWDNNQGDNYRVAIEDRF